MPKDSFIKLCQNIVFIVLQFFFETQTIKSLLFLWKLHSWF